MGGVGREWMVPISVLYIITMMEVVGGSVRKNDHVEKGTSSVDGDP